MAIETPFIIGAIPTLTNPVTAIFGVVNVLAKIIFSLLKVDNRIELTDKHWNSLVPYDGALYNDLRPYLKSRIKYDVDIADSMPLFTLVFIKSIGYTNLESAKKEFEKERQGTIIPVNFNFHAKPFNGTLIEQNFIDNFYTIFYGETIPFYKNPMIWVLGIAIILIIYFLK
jgi:hypothetical protein